MSHLLRLTALLLLFILLLSSAVACSATPETLVQIPLAYRDEATDGTAEGDNVAVAFSVTAPLSGIEFQSRITGKNPATTVKIYKANTDFETTMAEAPLREERFGELTEKLLWQFSPLEAGDYIILFTDTDDSVLVKSLLTSTAARGKILSFRQGLIMTDGTVALTLLCTPTDGTEPALKTFTYPVVQE